jgi:hypothetical protein
MAPPAPALGLVVHYGFASADKGQPCLIADLQAVLEQAPAGKSVVRVTYLPISPTAPREGESAIALPRRVVAHLGLTWERWWLYTSSLVEDDWPFDLSPVPGAPDRIDYGFVPPRLFAAVMVGFRRYLAGGPELARRR